MYINIHDIFTCILLDSTNQCGAPSVEYPGLNLPEVTTINNLSGYILLVMPICPWGSYDITSQEKPWYRIIQNWINPRQGG